MRYGSLFSGIEAASVAWLPLGWQCAWVAEIEPFPSAVLAHHYPGVPNLGDVTKISDERIRAFGHVDIVVFGFPCQDLSVAGNRAGFKDADGKRTRSGLFFEAMRLVRACGARWCLAENVPGLLSSNAGRDFALVVAEILGLAFDVPRDGWSNSGCAASDRGLLEWATLDAQYFGLAQRRKRVFALADFGAWSDRSPILLERESMCGHPAPSRKAGQVAPTIPSRSSAGGGLGTDFDCDGGLIAHTLSAEGLDASDPNRVSYCADVAPTLVRDGAGVERTGNEYTEADFLVAHTHELGSNPNGGGQVAIAFSLRGREEGNVPEIHGAGNTSGALRAASGGSTRDMIAAQSAVRRILPIEAERLQGFPPGYTQVPYRGKPASDGPRYRALGNSFAVPCIAYIGERIERAMAAVTESA